MGFSPFHIIELALLFGGLALLGAGFYLKGRPSHLIIASGEILFGIYWLLQVDHFLNTGDVVNAGFSFIGMPFFCFLAFHELLCWKWEEEIVSLRWIAGTSFLGGILYFTVVESTLLTKGLIYIVTVQSTWILTLFSQPTELEKFVFMDGEYGLPVSLDGISGIRIILACTGLQSMALFAAAIITTVPNRKIWVKWAKRTVADKKEKPRVRRKWKKILSMSDRRRKTLAFMYTVPLIYIANLFRNAAIIYVHNKGLLDDLAADLGVDPFSLAHHYIAKTLSLVMLIILVFILFEVLPEVHENMLGLADLRRRTRPGMIVNGYVILPEEEKEQKKMGGKPKEKERQEKGEEEGGNEEDGDGKSIEGDGHMEGGDGGQVPDDKGEPK